MKFLVYNLMALAVAQPLPPGPSDNRPRWIKINHVEHVVPAGLTPDQFYQMLTGTNTNDPTRMYPQVSHVTRPALPGYQAPTPYYRTTPPATSVQYPPTPWQYSGSFSGRIPTATNVQYPPFQWQNVNPTGGRQWVKVREGTQPIEVPAGQDPQLFLRDIMAARGISRPHIVPTSGYTAPRRWLTPGEQPPFILGGGKDLSLPPPLQQPVFVPGDGQHVDVPPPQQQPHFIPEGGKQVDVPPPPKGQAVIAKKGGRKKKRGASSFVNPGTKTPSRVRTITDYRTNEEQHPTVAKKESTTPAYSHPQLATITITKGQPVHAPAKPLPGYHAAYGPLEASLTTTYALANPAY